MGGTQVAPQPTATGLVQVYPDSDTCCRSTFAPAAPTFPSGVDSSKQCSSGRGPICEN